MRLLSLSSLALATACCVGTVYAETAPLSPEAQVQVPVKALRNNDFAALFAQFPASQQTEAAANWQQAGTLASPDDKAKMNQFFATLLAPDAVDTLMALAEPSLKQVNPQELVGYAQMFGGMAAMQMANDPKTAELGKHLQQLVADVVVWLPKSGIDDPVKLRAALTSVIAGTKAMGVTTADEFYALALPELLKRSGLAFAEVKNALKVYDLQADAVLDSIALTNVTGEGDNRSATANVTLFGHTYSLPVKMSLQNGVWVFKNEQLEQSLQGLAPGLLGGGEAAPAPSM